MGGLDRGFAAAIGTWSFQLEAPKQNFRGRRLMAHRVISARCRIWSLSGHSGLGRTCCWLDPVANDPIRKLVTPAPSCA